MSEELQPVEQVAVADAQQEGHSESPIERQEPDQDKNWKAMRNQMDELKRYNQRLEAEMQRMKQPPPPKEEVFSASDEDLSTVGLTRKIAQKETQTLLGEMKTQLAEEFARLKFPDYDAVVNSDNLQRLVQTAPELAKMLVNSPDPVGAYKLLKQVGGEVQDAKQLQMNQQKPRSVNSVGQQSALSQANAFAQGLTPDLKKSLWEEMKTAAKAAP